MMMISKIMLSGVLPFCHLEDDEFNVTIYELANSPVKFDLAISVMIWIQTLILTLINFTANIIQNTNLMNYWTKLALLVIPFTFRFSI